jgi:hypothetical protein
MDELLVAFVFVVAFSLFGYGVYLALTASVDTSYEGTATPPASSGFSHHQAYSGAAGSVCLPSGTDLPSHQGCIYLKNGVNICLSPKISDKPYI